VSVRQRLPATRHSLTHKARIIVDPDNRSEDVRLYITAGWDAQNILREFFLEGELDIVRAYDDWAISCSILLQSLWTSDDLVLKFIETNRPPHGKCVVDEHQGDTRIRSCLSIPDYTVRWLGLRFGSNSLKERLVLERRL